MHFKAISLIKCGSFGFFQMIIHSNDFSLKTILHKVFNDFGLIVSSVSLLNRMQL